MSKHGIIKPLALYGCCIYCSLRSALVIEGQHSRIAPRILSTRQVAALSSTSKSGSIRRLFGAAEERTSCLVTAQAAPMRLLHTGNRDVESRESKVKRGPQNAAQQSVKSDRNSYESILPQGATGVKITKHWSGPVDEMAPNELTPGTGYRKVGLADKSNTHPTSPTRRPALGSERQPKIHRGEGKPAQMASKKNPSASIFRKVISPDKLETSPTPPARRSALGSERQGQRRLQPKNNTVDPPKDNSIPAHGPEDQQTKRLRMPSFLSAQSAITQQQVSQSKAEVPVPQSSTGFGWNDTIRTFQPKPQSAPSPPPPSPPPPPLLPSQKTDNTPAVEAVIPNKSEYVAYTPTKVKRLLLQPKTEISPDAEDTIYGSPSYPPQRVVTTGHHQTKSVTSEDDTGEGTRTTLRSLEELAEQTLSSKRFSGAPRKEHDQSGRRRDGSDDARVLRRAGGRDPEDRPRKRDRYEDDEDDVYGRGAERRAQRQAEQARQRRERLEAAAAKRKAEGKPIELPAFISISNLAQLLDVHYDRFIKRLAKLGFDDLFASKVLDSETASLIAIEYGYNPFSEASTTDDQERDLVPEPESDPGDLELLPIRPPVVTIMGHVDHGKTTILDFLRKANVAAGEAGGITQHIGAFSVVLPTTGRTITFLDTPGHAAFLAMRQRGATVTDIVVLVVAADDSIMPQTLEALKHARAAKVPIIVAINKVDKPESDINRVKQDLSRHEVEIEDYGGDVQVIPVSGKTGQGMDALEEAIVTQAELLDYRAQRETSIDGWVLEATTKQAGRVATVLVRRGVLRPGSVLVAGNTWTKVRVLRDHTGRELQEASPGTSAEIDGWREQPSAGDRVLQAEDEQHAGSVVEYRIELEERKQTIEDTQAINKSRLEAQLARQREKEREEAGLTEDQATDTEANQDQSQEPGQQLVPFVIRADVSGSAEALSAYVEGTSSPMIAPQVLQALVGSVHESDVELASIAKGYIIAFNVTIDERIRSLAAFHKVKILEHNIIYRVVEDVKEILVDKLPPLIAQKVNGEAEVAQSFSINVGQRKTKTIAGCKIRNGVVAMGSRARIMRGTAKIYDGTISSLKNVKKDVTEMRKGTECGIGLHEWDTFEPGDIIQTYIEVNEKRTF